MEHSDDNIQWGTELLIRVAITLLIQDSVTALRSALSYIKLCESGLPSLHIPKACHGYSRV